MTDDERIARAKSDQDYDSDPPRCLTCVYFKYEPRQRYVEREEKARKGRGKVKIKRFRIKAHPLKNPMVNKCTFGNFEISRAGVCNEWRTRQGETLAAEPAYIPLRLVS